MLRVGGMFCLACWTNLPDTAGTCSRCGRDPRAVPPARAGGPAAPALRAGVSAPARPETAREGGGGSRWWVAAALVLGLSIGSAAAFLSGRPDGGRPGVSGEDRAPGAEGPPVGAEGDRLLAGGGSDTPFPALADAGASPGPAAGPYAAGINASRSGDYEGAVARLREARALEPDRREVEAALAAALEAAAGRALASGDLATAAAALEEAVRLAPERGGAWKALGYARLRMHDQRGAVASLETAARLSPRDPEVQLLLGTALYEAGDTDGAARHLRAGQAEGGVTDPRLAALLDKAEREAAAEQGYDLARSDHFAVSFEGGGTSAQAGYLVSLLLEEAYHAVGGSLGYRPAEPVHAVLYPAARFQDVTRSPSWAGALFDGKIRIPVGGLTEKSELLARVVRHEYTHAVVHRLGRGRAPVWLNEGLAMLNEGGSAGELLRQYREYVRRGGPPGSVRRLEGSFAGMSGAEAALAYARSLAATDYLAKRYGTGAARRIIELLGERRPLTEAIEATLFVSYEDFDRAWAASLR